jgi:hypothetical protein
MQRALEGIRVTMRRRARRWLTAYAVVAALVATIATGSPAAFAASRSNNRPRISVTPPTSPVTALPTTVSYTINRGGKQIGPSGLACTLTGPTTATTISTDCAVTSSVRGSTTGQPQFTSLETGTYTFTVNLTLDDGDTTSGSGTFTVALTPQQQHCGLFGGTYGNTNLTDVAFTSIDWTCNGFPAQGTLIEQLVRLAILASDCSDSLGVLFVPPTGPLTTGVWNTTCGTIPG